MNIGSQQEYSYEPISDECYFVSVLIGDFRLSFDAGEITWAEPRPASDCYFLPIIRAEENHHQAQYEAFNTSPPSALAAQQIIEGFNSRCYTLCPTNRNELRDQANAEFTKYVINLVSNELLNTTSRTRCSMEKEAKEIAGQAGALFFYSLPCAYPECNRWFQQGE